MAIDIQGHYAYIGNGRSFQILDITNLTAPVIVGEYVTSALIYDVRLRGDSVAFVCTWDGFLIFDVSNPTVPVKLSEIPLWGGNRVIPTDSFAYVASGLRLSIVDITDLRNPYIRSQAAGDEGGGFRDELALYNGRYLYLGDPDVGIIYPYDCSNPDNLQELPNLNIGWYSFSVSDRYSWLLVGTSNLKVYSLINPASPSLIDTLKAGTLFTSISVSDYSENYPYDVVFTTTQNGWLYTFDISSYPPHVVDSLFIPQIAGNRASFPLRVRDKVGISSPIGFALVDAQNPYTLQSGSVFISGGEGPSNIAVQGNYAYLANGVTGLAILDITNPTQPVRVGSLLFDGASIGAVAVEGSNAYVVGTYGYGFWTVDVSNPRIPVQMSWIPMGNPSWKPGLSIAVEKNRAYVALSDSGIVIIDVTNPAAPSRLGIYPRSVLSLAARDSLLFLSGMSILNVSDPKHVSQVSQLQIPSYAIVVDSTFAYNGGIVDTGLTVVDISNPSHPSVLSAIGMWLNGSNITDMALSGGYVYLSGNSLLYAVDVSKPQILRIVGSCNPIYSWGVAAQDRFVYLSESIDGLQIFENKLISHQQHYSFEAGWNLISVPAFPGGESSGAKNLLIPFSTSSAFTYET